MQRNIKESSDQCTELQAPSYNNFHKYKQSTMYPNLYRINNNVIYSLIRSVPLSHGSTNNQFDIGIISMKAIN